MTQLQSAVPLDQPYYGAPLSAAVQRFFRKCFTSHGRASRSEYWWWALVNAIVMAALGTALLVLVSAGRTVDGAGAATAPSDAGSVLSLLYLAWIVATIVPGLTLTERRLHDANKSGLWLLMVFVPIVGSIILLVFVLLPSDPRGARFDA